MMSWIFPWVMHDHDDDDEYCVYVDMYEFDFEFCGIFSDDFLSYLFLLFPSRQIMDRPIRDKG